MMSVPRVHVASASLVLLVLLAGPSWTAETSGRPSTVSGSEPEVSAGSSGPVYAPRPTPTEEWTQRLRNLQEVRDADVQALRARRDNAKRPAERNAAEWSLALRKIEFRVAVLDLQIELRTVSGPRAGHEALLAAREAVRRQRDRVAHRANRTTGEEQ